MIDRLLYPLAHLELDAGGEIGRAVRMAKRHGRRSAEHRSQAGYQRQRGQAEGGVERLRIADVVFLEHQELVRGERKPGEAMEQPGHRSHETDGRVRLADARPSERGSDQIQEADHRHRVGAPDVVGVLDAGRELDRSRECLGDLLDRNRLQPLLPTADHRHHRVAAHQAREHVDEMIAASIDDRGAKDRPRDGARANRLLRRPLAVVVAGAGAGPDAERAHVHVPAHAGGGGGLEYVDGPLGVDPLERAERRRLLADDAHEVDDRVAPLHVTLERGGGERVALDALDRLQPAEVQFRATANEAAHRIAMGAQGQDHGVPHETGGAGEKDPTRRRHDPRISIFIAPPRPPAKIDTWFVSPAGSGRCPFSSCWPWPSSALPTRGPRAAISPPWTTPPVTPCSPARSPGSWCWSAAGTTFSCCAPMAGVVSTPTRRRCSPTRSSTLPRSRSPSAPPWP